MLSMKLSTVCFFSLFIAFSSLGTLQAQGTSTIQSTPMKPLPPIQQAKPTPPPVKAAPTRPTATPTQATLSYFHPGIIILDGQEWKGSDHLLNLTNQIGVYVEIIRPENSKLQLNEEAIRSKVSALFNAVGIMPVTLVNPEEPPLPAFEIKIFLYPIERGYVAYCEGRLFESVILKRFDLDPGMAYQAITWQRQTLIVSPVDKAVQQIDQQINEIVASFIEIFQFFDKRKSTFMK